MKNLVNKFRSFLLIGMVALLAACTKVPAGNVGVKFDLYGGDKGVTGEVVSPGKYWLGWNEEMYLFPTFTQSAEWKAQDESGTDQSISFQDSEGIVINADVGISYAIKAEKADTVFQKYRKGVDEITDTYIRNMVRDALNAETSKMGVEAIYGPGKEELMQKVTQRVKAQVDAIGIDVEKIYWIGAMRLPSSIINAINGKIEATQKAQQRENELQTAKAQAEIERAKAQGEADAVMIAAKAEAEANRLKQATLTGELVQYTLAQRWDGKLPQVTGTATPLLNIK